MSRPWFVQGMHGLLRLYYPRIPVSHAGRLPAKGPAIVVANHPNGLLDPLVLRVGLQRNLRFLGKSTFWNHPVTRFAVESMDGLPAYRAQEADTSKNEATFAACRAHLAAGGWLALFPEGVSHSETELQPLKTGTARIALSAEAEKGWTLNLVVVPTGMLYEDKAVFRTAVGVVVGETIAVGEFRAAYEKDPREAAQALTERIAAALGQVVLQAEDDRLWRGILAVASWTTPDHKRNQGARDRRALALAAAARRLATEEPSRLDAVVRHTEAFAQAMEAMGVADPFSVEDPEPTRLLAGWIELLFLAPVAALGALLAWLPYRLARPLAFRIAKGDLDVVGTYKLFLGLFLIAPTYLIWALLAGIVLHPGMAPLVLLFGPLTGLVALRFDDLYRRRKPGWQGWWRSRDAGVVEVIRQGRKELSRMVETELGRAE